jgi:hypothetical protein
MSCGTTMEGTDMTVNDNSEMAVDQWLAIRKEEALKIDPSSAEVD